MSSIIDTTSLHTSVNMLTSATCHAIADRFSHDLHLLCSLYLRRTCASEKSSRSRHTLHLQQTSVGASAGVAHVSRQRPFMRSAALRCLWHLRHCGNASHDLQTRRLFVIPSCRSKLVWCSSLPAIIAYQHVARYALLTIASFKGCTRFVGCFAF